MVLDPNILQAIRDEIGEEDIATYDDAWLEDAYEDENRGNFSILATALIVWRRRLGELLNRSFDVTTEGSLLSRNQRVRYIERQIKRLENLVDDTLVGETWDAKSVTQQSADLASSTTEFS